MKQFLIDPGASQTWIAEDGKEFRTVPSVVMLQAQTQRLLAFGKDAERALERQPDNIEVRHPMEKGRIAEPDLVSSFLRVCTSCRPESCVPALVGSKLRKRLVLTVPVQTTKYECGTLEKAGREAGFREVVTVDEVLAHASGAGWDSPGTAYAVLVVGAAYAQAAVLKDGNVVCSQRVIGAKNPLDGAAGDAFCACLRQKIRSAHGLRIGGEQAENVLRTGARKISGFSESAGKAVEVVLTDDEIRSALDYPLGELSKLLTSVVDEGTGLLGDELRASVSRNGVLLTGGGAMFPWLEKELRERTKLAFFVPEKPRETAIRGLQKLEVRA